MPVKSVGRNKERGEVDYYDMASLFQGENKDAGVSSKSADVPAVPSLTQERRAAYTSAPVGGTGPVRRARLPYDAMSVNPSRRLEPYAGDNSKLSPDEFALATERLLEAASLTRATVEQKEAFQRAVYISHCVNSASQSTPGRATFGFEGSAKFNHYTNVVVPLGIDSRRYFRTAADDVVVALKELLAKKSRATGEVMESIVSVEARALERGLSRTPWLAFDAADAVSSYSAPLAERLAVQASKANVLPFANNAVDVTVAAGQLAAASEASAVGAAPAAAGGVARPAGAATSYGARVARA